MERRNFLKNLGLGIAGTLAGSEALALNENKLITSTMETITLAKEAIASLEFPALPYAYDALEPYIDAKTMEVHYDKHHRAYYNNYLAAVKGTAHEKTQIEKVFAEVSKTSDAIRNNGGGYYNHIIFWDNLAKGKSGPSKELAEALNKEFGSFDKFKELFGNAAKTRFGSGWAWLVLSKDRKLAIGSTANQDNPIMDVPGVKGTPLLALDVWEHAYYLKYQNRRPEYVEAFWNVVNWDEVNRRYNEAKK